MSMRPGTAEYLGDGVYAEFDGYAVSVDLRGEGRPEKIVFEPEVFEALKRFGDRAFEASPIVREQTICETWTCIETDDPVKAEPESTHGKCRCGGLGIEPHVCPLASEIRGDETTLCNCCDGCTRECALDI